MPNVSLLWVVRAWGVMRKIFPGARVFFSAAGTEFGTDFEWLCRYFLLTAPKYKGEVKSVWLWKDWPQRWGADKGIDLVAQTVAGKLWAIARQGTGRV